MHLAEDLSEKSIFPFFVFGLLAVALVRNQGENHKVFISGYRGIGLIVGFSAAVLLCATGFVPLFLPYEQRLRPVMVSW